MSKHTLTPTTPELPNNITVNDCPFCGSGELFLNAELSKDTTVTWYNIQHGPHSKCSIVLLDSDIDSLVKKWNHRFVKTMKDSEGYPMTPEQFYKSDWLCVKLAVKNEDVRFFEMACYNSIVRYIPVKNCLNDEPVKGTTEFFTRHILPEDLFRLGQHFERLKTRGENRLASNDKG